MSAVHTDMIVLITGGHGFIGSHVAARLHSEGHRVRIVDIVPNSCFQETICSEFIKGNLCDIDVCMRAVEGVDIVLHFAATMGGMGTIHASNDFLIYIENHTMTFNILSASVKAGVKRFFYASSACVYPEALQGDLAKTVSLRESDVWTNGPPQPQGLYGLEKLASENLLHQYRTEMDVRIARFHNVYGPRGSWRNGREKAPAAFLRKALAAKFIQNYPIILEVWGDGSQRRSYLWINDAVDAVLRLLWSDCDQILNIGSDRAVDTRSLAMIALEAVSLDTSDVQFLFESNKPIGVSSRNSNNDNIKKHLNWEPRVSLEEGMRRTGAWMHEEIKNLLLYKSDDQRTIFLDSLTHSQVVQLADEDIVFAILLPITSRGTDSPNHCLQNLSRFACSLSRTTWRETHQLGGQRYRLKIYLAIDEDDEFLLGSNVDGKKALQILVENGFDATTILCNFPRGAVCSIWRKCATQAWEEGCHYICLMGDDIILHDVDWLSDAHAQFMEISSSENVPLGFGCVAFSDISFPGMPTFPILHRTHMNIFNGQVIPEIFVNQDGDPYLFQLYRRWGCSRMFPSRVSNLFGGSGQARYKKQHIAEWTYETLDIGVATIEQWLVKQNYHVSKKLTLDVVIPCYRVQVGILDAILQLKSSSTCTVMFIIIVDNPRSPYITELLQKYEQRVDVRIRVNDENLGASASRNRGIGESAADWIHFLDDDITPNVDLLIEAERIIRAHPSAAGFVGNAYFPSADSIFTTAVHLAGVTYFWDIANKITDDMPWGVTANLIARRNVRDNVTYDLVFPKSGGGEDIDFVRRKREFFLAHGYEGFYAAPKVVVTHPWWNNGKRSYHRFYMWSVGDGALVKRYPQHVYRDWAPNSAELLLFFCLHSVFGLCMQIVFRHPMTRPTAGLRGIAAVIIANVIHDCYRHLWRDTDRTRAMKTSLQGIRWLIAVVESAFIRMASERGRVVGMLQRREVLLLGKRFDWFTGRAGSGPMDEERKNSLERLYLVVIIVAVLGAAV